MSKTAIVILNWNGRDHLERFLPSVIATTPEQVEIVVADNGSTDDSVQLIRQLFTRVRLVLLDRNYGFAKGYNMALRQIEADNFILLNSDVETTDGWCQLLIDRLESDSRIFAVAPKLLSYHDKSMFEYAGAAGGYIDLFGYPFCRGRILSTIEHDCGQFDSAVDLFWTSGAAMIVRSDDFWDVGGFDDGFFAHMEEIDLCWRAQLYGYRITVEPAAKVYHLGGGTMPNNSPEKLYLNYRNNLTMLYKNLTGARFWPVMIVRMVLDGASASIFLLQGHGDFFRAVLRAHRDFYRRLTTLHAQRQEIQQRRKSRPQHIYRGSIVLRYFLLHKQFGNIRIR